jgi:hypothetical protein
MPNNSHGCQHESNDSFPDISQLGTTYLRPLPPMEETPAQQVAQHEAEIQRLLEIADAVEQAITALVFRLHMATDHRLQEPLEHSRADLQRFKDELVSLQTEHQYAIERLKSQ